MIYGIKRGEILVEEDEVEMIAPDGNGEPITRIGRFLRPRANSTSDAANVPCTQSLREAVSSGSIPWPPKKLILEGWRYPQPKWSEWVEKLRPIYKNQWKRAGIFDAIVASTYEVRRHPSVFFALLLYWCPETNTFVFPWAEVTVTLEDIMILGGFPVLGEPVWTNEPLVGEAGELLQTMLTERKGFNKLSSKKASHYEWIKHYMEVGRRDQLEHVAFLSLWLSRFVFPAHPGKTVAENVFPIAIRLAQGRKIALAPAVLASIYRDLRLLRDTALSNGGEELSTTTAWAPFQIIQIWAWEHFVALRLGVFPHYLKEDEPRVARWHSLDAKLELSYVVAILESSEEFQWRPYGIHCDEWHLPSFYKEKGQWVSVTFDNDNEDGRLFSHFLRVCELVGMDCIEQYLPHRTAMQFGLDQDLPGYVPRENSSYELAWESYSRSIKDVKLYFPPRLFESDCTLKFVHWYQECLRIDSKSEGITPEHLGQAMIESQKLQKEWAKDTSDCTRSKEMKLEDQSSFGSVDDTSHHSGVPVSPEDDKFFSSAYSHKHELLKSERRMLRRRKLSNIYKGKYNQYDAMHQVQKVKIRQQEDEDYIGKLLSHEVRGFVKNATRPSLGSLYATRVTNDMEEVYSSSYFRLKMKEREERAARLKKEMELDAQIEKIKTEIAELQAKAMNMDSKFEMGSSILSTI